MRHLTIRAKLLLVVGGGFALTSLIAVFTTNHILIAATDDYQDRVYSERLQSVLSQLEGKQELLQKTGSAYRSGIQQAALKEIAANYYTHDKVSGLPYDKKASFPYVMDSEGKLILHPFLPRGHKDPKMSEMTRKVIESDSGTFNYEYKGVAKCSMYKKFKPWGWSVIYAVPLEGKYATVDRLQTLLLVIFACTGVIIVGAVFLLVSMTTSPIVQLNRAAIQMASGDINQVVDTSRGDEIGSLARSFSRMCEAIREKIRKLDMEVAERREAQQKLAELNQTLEQRVAQRTEELAQSEVALRHAKEIAEAASGAKGEFLANMSHEIRTPLTSILGYAELLADGDVAMGEQKEYLGTILRNGRHLLTLISDILDFSKIEAGKLTLDPMPTSIHSVVTNVASMLRVRAKEQGLTLTVEFSGETPKTILADESRVRQGLINLVGNAIKFTHRGGVHITTSFVPQWHNKAVIRIDVVDTGIGITPESLAELCQPFVQADASTSRKFGGTGLGLAITRKLLEMMGGALEIASKAGEGSIFSMIVPTGALEGVTMVKDHHEAVQEAEPSVQAAQATSLAGISVLLAEDGPDNRKLISTILKRAGADVAMVENGQQAVDLARSRSFDVILMDMQMPVMDGYKATSLLRTDAYAGPIIALTAHSMAIDRQRCLACGCTDYMSKPVKRSAIIALVLEHAVKGRSAVSAADAAPAPAAIAATADQQQPGSASQATHGIRSEFADDADLAELIWEFVAGLERQLQSMREAMTHGAMDELRRLAHQLKGSGGSYGYPCLTDAARELETAAEAGDIEQAQLSFGKLAIICSDILRGHTSQAIRENAQ